MADSPKKIDGISETALSKLGNDDAKYTLSKGINRSFKTVDRWIRQNDKMLSSKGVVFLIKEITGLAEEEILNVEPVTA